MFATGKIESLVIILLYEKCVPFYQFVFRFGSLLAKFVNKCLKMQIPLKINFRNIFQRKKQPKFTVSKYFMECLTFRLQMIIYARTLPISRSIRPKIRWLLPLYYFHHNVDIDSKVVEITIFIKSVSFKSLKPYNIFSPLSS